ncbi:MAG: dihydrofolate reductase [Fusobacteriaceae bacterium]
MLALIVAVDLNNGIGYQNELLFRSKEDMKMFKNITTGEVVVMGRNTWLSLPEKSRPLKNRVNYVISDQDIDVSGCENTFVLRNINAVANLSSKHPGKTIFIIGGASIYRQLMPYANKLFVTHFNLEASKVDTYFPVIKNCEWVAINANTLSENTMIVEYHRVGDEGALI